MFYSGISSGVKYGVNILLTDFFQINLRSPVLMILVFPGVVREFPQWIFLEILILSMRLYSKRYYVYDAFY